jgi:hypothetical protein
MDVNDINEFRSEFDAIKEKVLDNNCETGECDVPEESFDDYPDYVRAIYAEIMPPIKSGIYFSRWDIKGMAAKLDEHIVVDIRERMFQHYMRFITTREDMENVIEQFNIHIDMKCDIYREYSTNYPASKPIFDAKIAKAEVAKRFFVKILKDFFS